MMYANKFAVAIKSGRAVLREFEDTVYVPFGTEYSVFLKNLNSVRALATVTIDGESVTDGYNLVVPANGVFNLERFIKNGNLSAGNKLKFIERTAGVEKHRGIGVEDGLIRVEYRFEKPYPKWDYTPKQWVTPKSKEWWEYQGEVNCKGFAPTHDSFDLCDMPRGETLSYSSTTSAASASPVAQNCVNNFNTPRKRTMMKSARHEVENETGITAPGGVSTQGFHTANWFPTEDQSHVIVLRLLGETDEGKMVTKPVTVRSKPRCTSCGHRNKATAKFCSQCSTGLEIVV